MRLENTVKTKLDAGESVFGCFLPVPSPEMVELIALGGFDFVLIDAEHGPITPESAYPMVLAAEARGIEAFARVGEAERQVVLKYLDVGVSGLMAPQVNTVDHARASITATRYAPVGIRGLAGMRTFDYGLKRSLDTFVQPLNDRVMTILQFEHVETLNVLDDILAVPGLDCLFVGPSDLAQSMGFPGQPNHPDVTKVADEVVARAKEASIPVGTVAYSIDLAKAAQQRGFTMIVATAVGLLGNAAKAYLAGARG